MRSLGNAQFCLPGFRPAFFIAFFIKENYSDMLNNTKLLEKDDKAPDFTAHTYNNDSISLSNLKKAGLIVLVFIRGFS